MRMGWLVILLTVGARASTARADIPAKLTGSGVARSLRAEPVAPRVKDTPVAARAIECKLRDKRADRIVTTRGGVAKLEKTCKAAFDEELAVVVHEGWKRGSKRTVDRWALRGDTLVVYVVDFTPCRAAEADTPRRARLYAVPTTSAKHFGVVVDDTHAKCALRAGEGL